eukprot:596221-Alexandrium_andersonii.AAC.1
MLRLGRVRLGCAAMLYHRVEGSRQPGPRAVREIFLDASPKLGRELLARRERVLVFDQAGGRPTISQ